MSDQRPDADPTEVLPAVDDQPTPPEATAADAHAAAPHAPAAASEAHAAASPHAPTAPPRVPRWRRPAVIVSAALALVLIVVGVVWTVWQNAADARDQAIRGTATGYLDAVARGDANAALGYLAQQPTSRELLTDDVLKASAQTAPLTDITVTAFQARTDGATVAVAYKLGGQDVAADLSLVGDRTSWKLVTGLSELQVTNTAGLTVNGATITQTVHPVFPGTYTAAPVIGQLALDGAPTVTIPAPTTPAATLQVTPRLSDAGVAESRAALKTAIEACVASKVSAPPDCPWRIDETGVQVTPDSLRYVLKNDPWSAWTPTLDLPTMSAKGVAHYTVEATANVTTADRSGDITVTLDRDTPVTIDLRVTPLKVAWV